MSDKKAAATVVAASTAVHPYAGNDVESLYTKTDVITGGTTTESYHSAIASAQLVAEVVPPSSYLSPSPAQRVIELEEMKRLLRVEQHEQKRAEILAAV